MPRITEDGHRRVIEDGVTIRILEREVHQEAEPAGPLYAGGLITLWQLDTTMFDGGQWYYFTSATDFDHEIYWGGQHYSPIPMDATGFEWNTKGTLPQPTLSFDNIGGAGNLLLDSYGDLIGATVIRIQTLRRFLDDGITPDPYAIITRESFVVAQKMSHTALTIVFKLAARWDVEGTQLPRRQILRDICSHTYRRWNGSAFDYSKASCPYTGGGCWDSANAPTGPANDQCSRTLTGCSLRFGGSVLPARFFPGVGRVR
jgi:lambda family phage minor tail protein L